MTSASGGDAEPSSGLPPRALIVSPSAERAAELAADFDDVRIVGPDDISAAEAFVVVSGVPIADGSLRRVVDAALVAGDPELRIALDITDPIGLQLVHLDPSPLAGLQLAGRIAVGGIACAVLTRGDADAVPDLADLRDPEGTWTARHRAFGEAERLAADLNDKALRRRITELEAELARARPATAPAATKPTPAAPAKPARGRLAGRTAKLQVAAGGAVVIVAVAVVLALLTSTGYVGGLLTAAVLFGAVVALYVVRAHRRLARRVGRVDTAIRTLAAADQKRGDDTARRLNALTGMLRDGPPNIASIERQVDAVGASAVDISRTLSNLASGLQLPAIDARQRKSYSDSVHQTQAVANLFSMLPVDAVVPLMGGWAASADVVVALVDELLTRKPRLIVECGSGVSTLWLALAIRKYGLDSRIVCLEHDARFAVQTRAVLERHGVGHLVDVRDAPLTDVGLEGHGTDWYDRSALEDLDGIGLLFVDGPPEATGPNVRYPAVPLLRDKFAPEITIVLDDLIRPMEQQITRTWQTELPDFALVKLPLEKGASFFRR